MCEKLCEKYDPDQGIFLHWFNACLRNKYKDKIRAVQRDRSHKYTGELDPLAQVASGVSFLSPLPERLGRKFQEWQY